MTDPVNLRAAIPDDGELLWRWRNAPDVRAASLSNDEIPLDQHLVWYAAALSDPNRTIFIAERGGQPVGMVRLDRDQNTSTVNILIAADHRGTGVGRAALTLALSDPDMAYRAVVKADNKASLALFRSLGFRVTDDTDPITLVR